MAGRFEPLLAGNRGQRPGETEFVAVGVIEVEEALAPFGVAGRGSWLVSRCECTVVKCVNIGNVEDYPPPPGPAPLERLGDEVEIARPCSKAGERRPFAAMQDLKPQRAVKSDSSWHFVGAQCDGADPLDHGQSSPVLFPRAVGVATLTVSLFGVKALTFSRRKVVQAGNLTSICALSRCPVPRGSSG